MLRHIRKVSDEKLISRAVWGRSERLLVKAEITAPVIQKFNSGT